MRVLGGGGGQVSLSRSSSHKVNYGATQRNACFYILAVCLLIDLYMYIHRWTPVCIVG